MTATVQPALAPFGGLALGLSFGTGPGSQNDLPPVLPSVGALMSMHMRPIARALSADDVVGSRPKKASPALAQFAADWGRLPRTHTRFTDGAAILQKINPRAADSNNIEVLAQVPRAPNVGNLGALLRSSELDLVHTELEHLEPGRCVCTAGPGADMHGVRAALEAGEPLVVGVHAPLADGLAAIQPPIRLPQTPGAAGQHPSAVIMGAGAIARTTTPLGAPVLTRQVAGRSLLVYWTPVNQRKVPAGTAFVASMNRMMSGATLRSVTLSPGQWCVLPKGSVYVTLALGDNLDGTSTFAVQVKFTVHLPANLGGEIAARVGEKRKAFMDDDRSERSSQLSSGSSYAGSACGDMDCTCESDGDEDYDMGHSTKRARTTAYDHRYDHTTTASTSDRMVTRVSDSITEPCFPASSPSSLSHYSIKNSNNTRSMYL